MPNELYKKADDPTEFAGIIRDTNPSLDVRNTVSMERSRNIARERAREAARNTSRKGARR